MSSGNKSKSLLSIVFYEEAYQVPTTFRVLIASDGWLSFMDNTRFKYETGFPDVGLMMYDAEAEEFMPLITAGGLQVDPVLHPFVIIRARHVPEHTCPRLLGSIKHLKNARRVAQENFEAHLALENSEADFSFMGIENDEPGIDPVSAEADAPDFLNLSDINTQPDVRVMILFDEDENDPDYVYQASEASSSDEDMDVFDEGDEVIETDVKDDKVIVIDLTNLSSSSVCSQKI